MESKQIHDNGLGEISEVCLAHAFRTFRDRRVKDTDPKIVQMKVNGELIPHWYYRSDEFVDQPYFIAHRMVQPYMGPPRNDHAADILYSIVHFYVDEELTKIAERDEAPF